MPYIPILPTFPRHSCVFLADFVTQLLQNHRVLHISVILSRQCGLFVSLLETICSLCPALGSWLVRCKSTHHYGSHMRVASVMPVPWTRPCAGLWWCRRRLLVGGPCAYVPESIRYCYALRGPPPIVLGWGGHSWCSHGANIVMCSHGEVGLRRGLFTTELRKPARRSCLARAQGPAQGPSASLGGRWARGRFLCLGQCAPVCEPFEI